MTDLILVGGGLANSLIALFLARSRPDIKIRIFDKNESLGKNHTWSFHEKDVDTEAHEILAPLVKKKWTAQEVRFPSYDRVLTSSYHSIRGDQLSTAVSKEPTISVHLNQAVQEVRDSSIRLGNGEILKADCVIDGRGDHPITGKSGFQKFVGLDLRLKKPHGLKHPILMDARCPQLEGFRFFYCLPWDSTRLLIEDTRYSESPLIHQDSYQQSILEYASASGWEVEEIEHRESGVLRIPMSTNLPEFQPDQWKTPKSGLQAGFFHHTTSYSLPIAVQFAQLLVQNKPLSSELVLRLSKDFYQKIERENSYFRLLNRMLFEAASPERRFLVFEKFYRLPIHLIDRFYSSNLSLFDKIRIFSGKPPVPVTKALRCLR